MKVRTIRQHSNSHSPSGLKRHGRKYEVSELEGRTLIEAGLVEEDTGNQDDSGQD